MAFSFLVTGQHQLFIFFPLMVSQGTCWDTHVRDWQEQNHLVHRALVVGWGIKGSLHGVRETWLIHGRVQVRPSPILDSMCHSMPPV